MYAEECRQRNNGKSDFHNPWFPKNSERGEIVEPIGVALICLCMFPWKGKKELAKSICIPLTIFVRSILQRV